MQSIMEATQALKTHIERIGLPVAAQDWLLMLWETILFFDDVVDGEPIKHEVKIASIWYALIAMPQNAFYLQNAQALAPLMTCAFLKWKASDDAEREGLADEKSFMWRASYYDVLLGVVSMCKGADVSIPLAKSILGLYAEKYEDYKQEFEHA